MLSGAIYIHRISDIRMGGTSTRNFKLFRGLCGETMLRNVVIVTNMWGEVTLDVGEAREEELKSQDDFFKPVLERGAQLKRHYDTPASAHVIVGCVASKKPRALRIQRELVDEQRVITETTAGAELGRELHEQAMKFKEKRRQLQDEMDEGGLPFSPNSLSSLNTYLFPSVKAKGRAGSRGTRASNGRAGSRNAACPNRLTTASIVLR